MSTAVSMPAERFDKLRDYLIAQVSPAIDMYHRGLNATNEDWVAAQIDRVLEKAHLHPADEDRRQLIEAVVDETIGYGPIGPYLRDPTITEVMVNGPYQIYVERKGKLVEVETRYRDEAHLLRAVDNIVQPLGRKVDRTQPLVDARLPDGSRVNVIVPPCALNGPTVTIRKFPSKRITVDDLIAWGSVTPSIAEFLKACVISRLNIVVSGGTGSGKTTLLNVISAFIPEDERICTVEDAAELQLHQKHVVRMETAAPLSDGSGQVVIRDLVRNALRMRPERIVVGEVRGGEALDMLQAMNTGHDGSLTTVHANSPRDAIARLETLVLMAGFDLPLRVVRQQISSAVHLIVQQERLRDGSRKVTRVTEVQGMEGDNVVLQDIFIFQAVAVSDSNKVDGSIKATGMRPSFTPRLEQAGFKLSADVFGGASGPLVPPSRRK